MRQILLLLSVFLFTLFPIKAAKIGQEQSNKIIISDNDSTEDHNNFKHWQIKLGYSINNRNVFNVEGNYLIAISKSFAVSFDARLYSFWSLSIALTTRSIHVTKELSFSAKGGIGVIAPGPVAGLLSPTLELGFTIKYRLNKNYNIIFAFKQIDLTALLIAFETLPPKHLVKNFPIRFLSIGIEF